MSRLQELSLILAIPATGVAAFAAVVERLADGRPNLAATAATAAGLAWIAATLVANRLRRNAA
jgi:hypothetical protein